MNWTKERPTERGTYAWRYPGSKFIDKELLIFTIKDGEIVHYDQNIRIWINVSNFSDREWLKLPE